MEENQIKKSENNTFADNTFEEVLDAEIQDKKASTEQDDKKDPWFSMNNPITWFIMFIVASMLQYLLLGR